MTVYQVIGRLNYRGHKPGDVFEAVLDPGAERRGIARGNIVVIDDRKPELQPGSYKLPRDWATKEGEVQHDG